MCLGWKGLTVSPRIEELSIKNLRSIGDERVTVRFPETGALVLLGENNAGKSNITRALDFLFGDYWPGTRRLEEHDFHGRDSDGIAVEVGAAVSGIACPYCSGGEVVYFSWVYDTQQPGRDGNPVHYRFECNNTYCGKTWPNSLMRSVLSAAVLDADRRLDYQLSYASKYTMLSKLMHRFHERLLYDAERKTQLAVIFDSLLEQFSEVPEFSKFKSLLAETAEEFGQNLPYRLDVDFSAYDPSNFFRSLRVHPTLEGDVRSFDELGTGQSQVLALAFAYAYAMAYGRSEGTVLVIDEPEANLHPLAQQWLATRLNRLAAPGLQVVVTTHSPHFVDLAKPENLVMVKKDESGATQVVQRSVDELTADLVRRGADTGRTLPETIGPFYAAGATTEIVSGLFARRCVLVEGRTESLALPELLRARGLDVLREGVAVVSVEGIGNIAKWHRLYTALGIECFCIFDTDSDKGSDANLRAKRLDIAGALGLEGDPAEAATVRGQPLYIGDRYATLDPNFEGSMKALFGDEWTRLHDEAVSSVGESKPLRARYAAHRLADSCYTGPPGVGIDRLIRAIRGEEAVDGYDEDGNDDSWPAGNLGKAYDTEGRPADEPPF